MRFRVTCNGHDLVLSHIPQTPQPFSLSDPQSMPSSGSQFLASASAAASSRLRTKIRWWDQTLDPGSEVVAWWNQVFLVACLIAMFLDPLYFFLPVIGGPACVKLDVGLGIVVTFFRSVTDAFYVLRILIKFRTAYVAPNSRVFGRGELVTDRVAIAGRYLRSDFIVDLAAALPLPQMVTWFIIPALVKNATAAHANHTLSLIVLVQYVPRLFLLFPLHRRIVKTTGAIAKTAWAGAAYNLLLYILASHVTGAAWYVLSIQRQYQCWNEECAKETNTTHSPSCDPSFLDCNSLGNPARQFWLRSTRVIASCDALSEDCDFEFGMYGDAFTSQIASSHFAEKYFYCLWWGLRSLSSYGQSIVTSTINGEIIFSIFICSSGLVLFSHLIGNMQSYLQSTSARLEEWRVRRRDTEEWMRHRQLPMELQERVRQFVQYKWIATRGVNEESILHDLPLDLRRQIQRHLCLALVCRVPFFAQMDDQLIDAICERLVSSLNTKYTFIVREGDPVSEMLFIIRGHLESSTTDGGRVGFFNSIVLRPGDFCGEELLTWALLPATSAGPSLNLPASTRTVRSLSEVEAFALRAEDLRFVAGQFQRLHSKRLQQSFRYYSHQWRAWGACYVQVAWRRYWKRRVAAELARLESGSVYRYASASQRRFDEYDIGGLSGLSGEAGKSQKGMLSLDANSLKMPKKLFKPEDPDFSAGL